MPAISPSNSERHAFVDGALDTMRRALDDPFVQRSLGDRATAVYSEMIDTVFVPRIVNGVVQPPEDPDNDGLPVVAINRSEVVSMEPYYHTQTRLQRAWAKTAIEQWRPLYDGDAILDFVDVLDDSTLPVVGIEDPTLIKVTASSRPISPRTARQLFEKPPEGIGIFKKRPVLMLGIDGHDARFAPFIAHELEHVRQSITRPVQFIKSQNDTNMQALRHELESMNVAATFAYAALQNGYDVPDKQTDEASSVVYPIAIDQIRKGYQAKYGSPDDPFRPTGGLFKELTRHGHGAMLHEAIDFELVQRLLLENDSQSD